MANKKRNSIKQFVCDCERQDLHTPQACLQYFYNWRSKFRYKEPIEILRIEPKDVFIIYYRIKKPNGDYIEGKHVETKT